MMDINEAIKKRESGRRNPFPISVQQRTAKPDVTVTKESFIGYYTHRFYLDLQKYYDISMNFGDRSYPFVLEMGCGFKNHQRLTMKWDGISHFYMFSVSVYFMSMCTQVVGKLYGWKQMENFMRASGWPMLNCGMGGLMHPIQVIFESELFPQNIDNMYYDVLHIAKDYLMSDFIDFLKGHAANINNVAYKKLCKDVTDLNIVSTEIDSQVDLFESWIRNPDTEYPGAYVKYPDQQFKAFD